MPLSPGAMIGLGRGLAGASNVLGQAVSSRPLQEAKMEQLQLAIIREKQKQEREKQALANVQAFKEQTEAQRPARELTGTLGQINFSPDIETTPPATEFPAPFGDTGETVTVPPQFTPLAGTPTGEGIRQGGQELADAGRLAQMTPRQIGRNTGLFQAEGVVPEATGIIKDITRQEDIEFRGQVGNDKARNDAAKRVAEKVKSAKDILTIEQGLRKEYNSLPIVKNWAEVREKGNAMNTIWNDYVRNPDSFNSKLGLDQALVTLLNKMLDPGSVVRESEFARTAEGQGVIDQIKGLPGRIKDGGVGLVDYNRQEVVDIANLLLRSARFTVSQERERFLKQVGPLPGEIGADVDRVLGDIPSTIGTGKRVDKPRQSNFSTEAEARKAGFKNGDTVTIGGVRGVLTPDDGE